MRLHSQNNSYSSGKVASVLAAGAATTLAEVLARPDIWLGDALATAPRPGVSTGFAALDAELPGGGWPRGAVVELMSRHSGIGEMALLMPALAAQFSGNGVENSSWTICVAPPLLPFAPGWAPGWGSIALQRLMVIRARGDDAAWACARALDTEGVGTVLAWLPDSRAATIRRLQLLAERSEALVFVFRPCACATQSSPAPLRLMLEASGYFAGVSPAPTDKIARFQPPLPSPLPQRERGQNRCPEFRQLAASETSSKTRISSLSPRGRGIEGEGGISAPATGDRITTLTVHLIKRRGAGRAAPLYLSVPRPRRQSYAVPELLPQVNPHVVVESAISAIPA